MAKDANHTDGPWTAGEDRDYQEGMIGVWRGEDLVAVVCHHNGEKPGGRGEANARLIAAAPELLEALEEILSADSDMPSYQSSLDKAEAAINKARGEPNPAQE